MSHLLLFALTIACSSQTETMKSEPTEPEKKTTVKKPPRPHKPIPLSPKMLELQGQLFKMGRFSYDKKSQRDEKEHTVDFSGVSFMISTTEVTQELYEAVTGVNPSKKKSPQNPVERVSWLEAIEFCNLLSQKEDLQPVYRIESSTVYWDGDANGYRLPTEAEWEYAAKSNQMTLYSGSVKSQEVAWTKEVAKRKHHPVGQKKPNAFGLYDMSGNVYEWVWDWHQCTTLAFDGSRLCDGDFPQEEGLPTGWKEGVEKVFRGGSFKEKKTSSRVSNRGFYLQTSKLSNVGFRLARNITTYNKTIVSEERPKASLTEFFADIEEGCRHNPTLSTALDSFGTIGEDINSSWKPAKSLTLPETLRPYFGRPKLDSPKNQYEYSTLVVKIQHATYYDFPVTKIYRTLGHYNGINSFSFILDAPLNEVKPKLESQLKIVDSCTFDTECPVGPHMMSINATKDGKTIVVCDSST